MYMPYTFQICIVLPWVTLLHVLLSRSYIHLSLEWHIHTFEININSDLCEKTDT